MKWLTLGALLGLLWILCPALIAGAAANTAAVAFGLGFATRPAVARRIRRWAA